jgi:hypothetical protein
VLGKRLQDHRGEEGLEAVLHVEERLQRHAGKRPDGAEVPERPVRVMPQVAVVAEAEREQPGDAHQQLRPRARRTPVRTEADARQHGLHSAQALADALRVGGQDAIRALPHLLGRHHHHDCCPAQRFQGACPNLMCAL